MSVSADVEVYRPYTFGSALISALFFITPVVTTAVPRVTWLFFPLIAFSLILPAVRRGERHQLIQPNSALIACSLVAGYILLNATLVLYSCAALRNLLPFPHVALPILTC